MSLRVYAKLKNVSDRHCYHFVILGLEYLPIFIETQDTRVKPEYDVTFIYMLAKQCLSEKVSAKLKTSFQTGISVFGYNARFVDFTCSAMSKRQTWLVLTALFTLLFIVLIAIGAHLISIESKQFGIAAFLFAFAAAFGQIACLALFLREQARHKVMQAMQQSAEPSKGEPHV